MSKRHQIIPPIQTHVKQTSRGFRLWLEGSKLSSAGFHPNTRFNMHFNEAEKRLELALHPEGKRKVSNSKRGGKDRPIIDIESKKIGAFFGVNAQVTIFLGDGQIHAFKTPTMEGLQDRVNHWVYKDKDSDFTSLRSLQPSFA